MDNLTYNADDVARMLNRSKSTAYRRIYKMNLEYCKKNKLNMELVRNFSTSIIQK